MLSLRRVRVCVAIGAMLLLGVAPSRAGASPPRTTSSWAVRIAIAGQFSGLLAAHGSLYSIRDYPRGPLAMRTQVVRIDPASGKVVAVSRYLPGIASLVAVGGAIWTAGVTFYSASATREGPPVLEELDATTLHRERERLIATTNRQSLYGGVGVLGAPGGRLFEVEEARNGWGCSVHRLDAATGLPLRSVSLVIPGSGGCSGIAFSPSGSVLYAATGQGGLGDLSLVELDAHTGAVIARVRLPQISDGVSLVATSNRVWLAGGMPGDYGYVVYVDTSPLRVLAESEVDGSPPKGVAAMPYFSQFPTVDESGGRVWVGSDGTVACFGPANDRPLSLKVQYHGTLVTDSVTVIGHEVWANSNSGGPPPPTGLVSVRPPARCGR